ncbi:hypothetical protein BDN72DRAFT_52185 [Pluteus cervinus]|uniref:Uncharacterized protein n=1 Tax=Pluteus cervinus TaxID=181527 RepID=A0ACD3B986_9AGAR|nr:hypothetical protein BDN72DRAFT_52185 [Pluteus cervinus]
MVFLCHQPLFACLLVLFPRFVSLFSFSLPLLSSLSSCIKYRRTPAHMHCFYYPLSGILTCSSITPLVWYSLLHLTHFSLPIHDARS